MNCGALTSGYIRCVLKMRNGYERFCNAEKDSRKDIYKKILCFLFRSAFIAVFQNFFLLRNYDGLRFSLG